MRTRLLLMALSAVVLTGAADAAAGRCKQSGKPIVEVTVRPLAAEDGTTSVNLSTLEIFRSGAWSIVESPAGGDPIGRSGCARRAHVGLLVRAVAEARFRTRAGGVTCMALPTHEVTIEAPRRRKRVVARRPCGAPLDAGSDRLLRCARELANRRATDAGVRTACR